MSGVPYSSMQDEEIQSSAATVGGCDSGKWRRGIAGLFYYDTHKKVRFASKGSLAFGVIHRLYQVLIIVYIAVTETLHCWFVMYFKSGYQTFDNVEGTVTSKVKGIVKTNHSSNIHLYGKSSGILTASGVRVWDTADYVVPPQENGAFFVMTNYVIAPDQEQGICTENPEAHQPGARCTNDADCPADSQSPNGIRIGTCNNSTGTCDIYAWCPVETDLEPTVAELRGTENFTVLIKNQIIFPKFLVKRSNILDDYVHNKTLLSMCRYDQEMDPYCPIFRLGDIVRLAGENYNDLATRGGVMKFIIRWDCNLDNSDDECRPIYLFRRIDNRDNNAASGYNFRFAHYWSLPGPNGTMVMKRTLIKAIGLRFIFYVYGQAGKFDAVTTSTEFGANFVYAFIPAFFLDLFLRAVVSCVYRTPGLFSRSVVEEIAEGNQTRNENVSAHQSNQETNGNVPAVLATELSTIMQPPLRSYQSTGHTVNGEYG